jgi:DNA-binding beta-propeller fold protein YncE
MIIFNRFKIGLIAVSLLVAALAWAPLVDAAPKPPSTTGKSDLNRDGVVNYDDLVIFSSDYLGQNVETVDWCAFWEGTSLEADLYGRPPSFYIKHFSALITFINNNYGCDRSDLNMDGMVNIDDLKIFSFHFLELNWDTIDWCAFYIATAIGQKFNDKPTSYYQERFRTLLGFINDHFGCDTGPVLLKVENKPKSLTRMAAATDASGNSYFTDPRVGSVFIYNANLSLIGEIKNLNKPLGVAIDSQGYLLVGSNGNNNIEVYDPVDGNFLASFGDGLVKMPTAITIGPEGKIYVTDSRNHNIHVFDPAYISLGTIGSHGEGEAELDFPTDAVIVKRMDGDTLVHELYVTDQGNNRVQVYDLQGNYLNAIYGVSCGWFSCPDAGTFNRVQAIEVDSLGRLHILDIFEAKVAIMDVVTGDLLGSYGAYGRGPGLLRVPVDLLLTNENTALVTDGDSDEIEVFAIP